jgi:hypothetical protein
MTVEEAGRLAAANIRAGLNASGVKTSGSTAHGIKVVTSLDRQVITAPFHFWTLIHGRRPHGISIDGQVNLRRWAAIKGIPFERVKWMLIRKGSRLYRNPSLRAQRQFLLVDSPVEQYKKDLTQALAQMLGDVFHFHTVNKGTPKNRI